MKCGKTIEGFLDDAVCNRPAGHPPSLPCAASPEVYDRAFGPAIPLGPTVPFTLPDVLTAEEAADLLRLHVHTVYEMCRPGAPNPPPHRRAGRALRFSRAGLLQWLANNEGKSP